MIAATAVAHSRTGFHCPGVPCNQSPTGKMPKTMMNAPPSTSDVVAMNERSR